MTTSNCGCKEEKTQRGRDVCEPCEVGKLCRNHYYTGKLMTARDFKLEQGYFRDKLRLHHQALHGWGVVCGLQVRPHPYCPDLRIELTPGMAVDPCGREVRVLDCAEFLLPAPPKTKKKAEPCQDDIPEEPDPEDPQTPEQKPRQGKPEQAVERQPPQSPPMRKPPKEPPPKDEGCQDPPPPPKDCDDKPKPEPCPEEPDCYDLYVCIRYYECEEEFSPAPFDECSCNGTSLQPSHVCEGFHLEIHDQKPKWWDDAFPGGCPAEDCTSIWKRARKCPEVPCVPCIPLAVIRDFVPGKKVTEEQIDNSTRVLLPSTTLIKEAIDCILENLPIRDYTKIEYFNWPHGRRMHCHEFFQTYIGSKEYPGYFEMRFSRPVVVESVSTRSFHVTVVYRDDPSVPREMHMAPARITADAGGQVFRLEIDHVYAHKHLHNRKFDLFIRLAGDKVLDIRGDAVDANLLARRESDDVYVVSFPTGDGTKGGEFESWISVR